MKTMRLRRPASLDSLDWVDGPEAPPPGPGAVTLRVRASSLNYHDYAVCSGGGRPVADGRIPLADGAGTIEAVGDGVTGFAVGDHAVSTFFPTWLDGAPVVPDFSTTPGDGVDGFARSHVTLPATALTPAPRGWTHAEAATLTTAGLTAWRALVVNGGLKPGDRVLVMGTGGVSIFALQLAKAMGASVVATSSSAAKLERLTALGADHVLNYREEPEWGRTVAGLTGGGVDHVVEVGGPGTLKQSVAACRVGGHISLIGVLTGREGVVPTAALMAKQQALRGLIVGSRRHQLDMVRGLDAMGLRPVIDRSFALTDLAGAFRHEASGAHFGKIAIEV